MNAENPVQINLLGVSATRTKDTRLAEQADLARVPLRGNSQRATLAALPWSQAERERTRQSRHGTPSRCIVVG
jgi:hypothetical protein